MRTALQALAVAALLVLAGCSGTGAPATTDTTTAPTTTDHPTTTEQPTTRTATTTAPPSADALPPGVTEDGVANASALLAAHRSSVLANGAVVTGGTSVNGTVDNQTVRVNSSETVELSPGADRYRRLVTGTSSDGNETTDIREAYYANRSAVVVRVTSGDADRLRTVDRTGVWSQVVNRSATQRALVETVLSHSKFTVADTEQQNGRTVTTLVAVEGSYSGPRSLTSYDASLRVAESGRVLALERAGTAETNNSRTRFRSSYSWSGAEPIEPPAWLPRNESDGG